MGKFEDYINSLEGKDDLVIENVVSELLNIHNDEVGIASAKISDLDSKIAENVSIIAKKDEEIQRVKSINWDLANQVPVGETENRSDNGSDDGKPDAAHITIDDLLG